MAATGGGKIRTRRYHVVSKPYAKAKQPGLISRVTDTVKSIVPSWLQKYFKNGELAEEEETPVQVEQNDVTAPPNGSQESAPLPNARDSPEPSTSNAEPSTSKASLNFQDVLSRPPLNRSHLHFPSHDGSPALSGSLFSQPSTSTAPPFPPSPFAVSSSFIPLVKEIKDSSSQHEDDNISTTSGFSSRASDKDVPTSKTAPLLWSPETERTQSASQLAHSSLKKPAFNLSVFGTSSSSAMNSSVLNSSQLGDSPFYPGKTTYGGAAAAKAARSRPGTPYHAPVRRQIKAKPAGAQPCGVTSATARRILQSLERMSSPLADAKRIPSTVSSPLSTSLNHSALDGSGNFQSKRKKLEPAVPPVQKLVIPAVAAVSGNRSMSFRPSLTPGSVSRVLEKISKETPVRRSPQVPDAVPAATASISGLSYPLSSTPAASVTSTGGGKMKRERSVRPSTKRPDDEVVEVPNLPAVSLPISNFNLPTFTFSSPPPASTLTPSTTPRVSEKAAISKETNKESTPVSVSFTFSSPIVKATAASPPSFSSSPGFTFSAPTMKTGISMSNGKLPPAKVKTAGESSEEFQGPFKPAKTLKRGSVLDVLKEPGFSSSSQKSSATQEARNSNTTAQLFSTSLPNFGEKFKPAAGSWNCGTCMVQNKPSDKKCVACQAPQPSTDFSSKLDSGPAKAPAASLSSLFAPPAGSWECDTCLVQNKPEVVKCVACETAKPGTGVKPALSRPPVSEVSSTLPASSTPAITSTFSSSSTTTTTAGTTSGLLSFADKFKKPEGMWNCDVCMVDNKAQDVKCVACQNAKPGAAAALPSQAPLSQASASTPASTAPLLGFGDKFKKPEGSWDCDVCCVQNKAADQKCVACETPKPGAKVETKGFAKQSFSMNSTSTSFKFGAPPTTSNSASSELKFGGSFSNPTSSSSFKFGNASSDSTSTSSGFKFGSSSSESSSGAFKFGGASTEQSSTGSASTDSFKFGGSSNGFKFGADSTSGSTGEEKKSEPQNPGAGFKFGGSTTSGFGSTSTAATTASQGFSFGLSKPSEEKTGSNLSFSFSAPKASEVEKENPLPSREAVLDTSNTVCLFSDSLAPEADQTTGQLFGEETPQKTSTAAFMFGKPEEKKDTSTISTGFIFSTTKEAANPAPTTVGFNFNKPDPTKEVPKPTFTFGKPTEPAETQKPVFGFGQNATDTAAPKPAFAFIGGSSTAPAPAPAPAPASSSLFGTPSSSSLAPTPAPSSTFVFGQGSSSETPSKTFLFGQQQQETQPASTEASAAPNQSQPFVFGSMNSSTTSPFAFGAASSAPASSFGPAASAPASSFGAAASAPASSFGAAASAPASSFGAAASAPASSFGAAASAPSSSFGAAASAPASTAPAPSPFGFTATTSASGFGPGPTLAFGSSQSAVPVFGSAASSFTATPSAAAPAFGVKPNTQSVFGQQANSTPGFGSSTAPSGQGSFQFGGNNAFGATGGSSNSSVFTFGAGAAGATGSPAGAPAMSAQPAAPGGGFGFSPSAAFNIGSAKNANAPTNRQHAIAGRKIKTAVRRRK
ncbi:nuclear pore complex protein Nup153 isoform X2 [Clarias gariepinus]|uniref:nuclear pore complex protein Nup153 isoform X2 n=1 Tax=Clarias gariepinus TaxID=13013 RepID=UPI00234D150A|nr:nuclear pore complex protein Nup153 isoform X2 [Clarias gariepinus]